jgi:hypothetical protein
LRFSVPFSFFPQRHSSWASERSAARARLPSLSCSPRLRCFARTFYGIMRYGGRHQAGPETQGGAALPRRCALSHTIRAVILIVLGGAAWQSSSRALCRADRFRKLYYRRHYASVNHRVLGASEPHWRAVCRRGHAHVALESRSAASPHANGSRCSRPLSRISLSCLDTWCNQNRQAWEVIPLSGTTGRAELK